MTEATKQLIHLTGIGLKDSILGTFKLFRLDKDLENERKEAARQASSEPMSTLARRRAEKMKQKKTTSPDKEPKVLQRILLCCAWNGGVFGLSILLFNNFVIPALEYLTHFILGESAMHNFIWSWMSPMLTWTFSALWVLPLFILSKIVNSLWFQDIADAAYRISRGRPAMFPSLSKFIADILFSLLLQALFLIQGMIVSLVPFMYPLGPIVSIIHMTLLYSMYAFEYKWFNMGWEVQKRLMYIECNWPYFVGFGLPMAVFTSLPSSYIISGCVFSLLFPLFIISANEAEPIPQTFDYPLRIFSFVVSGCNSVFQHSVKKKSSSAQPGSDDPTPSGSPTPSTSSSLSGGSSVRGDSPPRGYVPRQPAHTSQSAQNKPPSQYDYAVTTKARPAPKGQAMHYRSSKGQSSSKAPRHESDYY